MTIILIALVILGLLLVFVEFFIPGGIVGAIGGLVLFVAVVMAFVFEGAAVGSLLLVGTLLGVALLVPLWMKLFPGTLIGRKMTLSGHLPSGDGDTRPSLTLGARGVTLTPLRPSGTARFGAERVDVLSEGRMIDSGTAIEVLRIDGHVVVVRCADPTSDSQSPFVS